VLTEPKHSLTKQFAVNFKLDDVDFHMTEQATRAIAKEAQSRGTGARGLRAIMESLLLEAQFTIPSDDGATAIIVDEAAARGESPPIILRDDETLETYLAATAAAEAAEAAEAAGNLDQDAEREEADDVDLEDEEPLQAAAGAP
jgi:hypothetical protein